MHLLPQGGHRAQLLFGDMQEETWAFFFFFFSTFNLRSDPQVTLCTQDFKCRSAACLLHVIKFGLQACLGSK